MHFEENQLYPSSIGISPLSTVHPPRFQPGSVRASTRFYPRFTLTMDKSLGFGSTQCDYHLLAEATPYSDSLSLRLRVSTPKPRHTEVTRWLILQKARNQACPRRGIAL